MNGNSLASSFLYKLRYERTLFLDSERYLTLHSETTSSLPFPSYGYNWRGWDKAERKRKMTMFFRFEVGL